MNVRPRIVPEASVLSVFRQEFGYVAIERRQGGERIFPFVFR